MLAVLALSGAAALYVGLHWHGPAGTPVAEVSSAASAGPSVSGSASAPASAAPALPALGANGAPGSGYGPYLYLGWGDPPDPVQIMSATGIRMFTMAFMLADNRTCKAAWDGDRPLTGGDDQNTIDRIHKAGGEVVVSFGGNNEQGTKLSESCPTAAATAAVYQQVIDTYKIPAIDIDLEGNEFEKDPEQQKVIDALVILKQNRPNVGVYLTFPAPDGDRNNTFVQNLITKGGAAKLEVDGWVEMPFNFGGAGKMAAMSETSAAWVVQRLVKAYGYTTDVAYRHMGFATMNGNSDMAGEVLSIKDLQTILSFAKQHSMAKVAFWSLNRDRSCPNNAKTVGSDSCSGVVQQPWDYSRAMAAAR